MTTATPAAEPPAPTVAAPPPEPATTIKKPLARTPSTVIHLAVMNDATSGLTDAQVALYAAALQRQITYNFYPEWGINALVTFVPAGEKAPSGSWWLVVLGNTGQAGALGYHDLTPEGNPCGYVGAKDDEKYGSDIGVTVSHEGLEMLLDPWINDCRAAQDANGNPIFWATEACDAIEDDQFAYEVAVGDQLVKVSNFVLPDFFNPAREGQPDAVYDWKRVLTAPFSIASGGYLSKYVPGQGWSRLASQDAKEIPDPDDPADRAWGRGSRPTRRPRRQMERSTIDR